MATSQEATQATENNRKLFRRYGKMFALADHNVYTSHADKLSLWLNDIKAYYTSARPEVRIFPNLLLCLLISVQKIVKLLLASHMPGRIHFFNNHLQDRSSDPSKSLGPSRALEYAFQHLGVLRTSYDEIVYKFGENCGAF
jgi:hypothetical protein